MCDELMLSGAYLFQDQYVPQTSKQQKFYAKTICYLKTSYIYIQYIFKLPFKTFYLKLLLLYVIISLCLFKITKIVTGLKTGFSYKNVQYPKMFYKAYIIFKQRIPVNFTIYCTAENIS